jgi:hypothetical protein
MEGEDTRLERSGSSKAANDNGGAKRSLGGQKSSRDFGLSLPNRVRPSSEKGVYQTYQVQLGLAILLHI